MSSPTSNDGDRTGDRDRETLAALTLALERVASSLPGPEIPAAIDRIVDLLVARGLLTDGHRALVAKAVDRARRTAPTVRLRIIEDKYRVPNSDVDCASLLHLCHARCCAWSFELSRQDLDEGKIRWEIDRPYLIRHEDDGYCTHLDRERGGCGVYEHRPGTCRAYDCRHDPQVWIDFDRRIPAPLPPGLRPPPRRP